MYLLKIYEEGTGLRVRAVSGQSFKDGKDVSDTYNVQGDLAIRTSVGPGGYLVAKDLVERGMYYQAPELYCADEAVAKKLGLPAPPMEGAILLKEHLKGRPLAESTKPLKDVVDKETFLGKLQSSRLKAPEFNKTGFHIDGNLFWVMARNIKKQTPTIIYGHAGTGKTELVALIAKQMGLPLSTFDMGAALDPTATLIGVHRLKDGKSVFDYSRFYYAIQEPGIILLDELSRAPENTTNLLLPCLDGRRTLYADVGSSDEEREIKIHPDCVFIATANVGSEYTGVNLLDKALMSRFFKVELDYPDNDIEVAILNKRTGVDPDIASVVVSICHDIRGDYAKGVLSRDVSMRESLTICEFISDGFPLTKSLELVLLPCFEKGEEGSERAAVMGKILAM